MLAHTIYCWYIVDNSVKEVYCFTWKSHFGCFRLFRGCFRPFRGCFRPQKKNTSIKKTANIIHRAFLFTWIVHQDLIRIPQNMDKITFRLSFQFPPQADIWGQAEIQALWKIQVYMYTSLKGPKRIRDPLWGCPSIHWFLHLAPVALAETRLSREIPEIPASQKSHMEQTPWRIHGAGIYANIKGVYWWDPCYHI